MAATALIGLARKSPRVRSFTSVFLSSSGLVDQGLNRWPSVSAPAWAADRRFSSWALPVVLVEKENGQRSKTVNWALPGILSAGLAVLLGLQSTHGMCDAATDLQTGAVPESVVFPSKHYNLLADSYRRQVFFNYERRIRMHSRPEKVFGYFASQRDSKGQPYMTPTDLMRALVPIFPPSESATVREGRLDGERSPGELSCAPSEFFMLFDMNGDGLVSFAEYIFFVTLLGIPEKQFKAAFKMFDLDGNGKIDRDEFKEVMTKMREKTRQGLTQRTIFHSALEISTSMENSGLVEYFFGKDGKSELRHEDFERFLRQLHVEMTRLEFAHYDIKQKGSISAHDFGLSMIAAADMDLLNEYVERAMILMTNPRYKEVQISLEEFQRFAELRKKRRKLALAMSSYGALNRTDFQRAAAQVCNVPLSSAMVEVIFQLFDMNEDGYLSSEEFLHAMERRESDMANPRETGLVSFMKCWWRCGQGCQNMLRQPWKT